MLSISTKGCCLKGTVVLFWFGVCVPYSQVSSLGIGTFFVENVSSLQLAALHVVRSVSRVPEICQLVFLGPCQSYSHIHVSILGHLSSSISHYTDGGGCAYVCVCVRACVRACVRVCVCV